LVSIGGHHLARLRLNTFNALIDAVGRHEGLKSAERTFAKIIEEGLRPDRVTFTMMLGRDFTS